MTRSLILLLALLGASGCATAPLPTFKSELQTAGIAPAGDPLSLRVARTPRRTPFVLAIAPGVVRDPPKGGAEFSSALPLDPVELQRTLTSAAKWSQLFGDVVSLPADALELPIAREAAEVEGAQLLLRLVVDEYRVRFVRDDGLRWWTSMIVWWGLGPPFAWWIADEVFEARLIGTLRVLHVRSGEVIAEVALDLPLEASLDDFQHGFHVLSHLRIPESLDEENWLAVDATLRPALLPRLEVAAARALLGRVTEALGRDDVQRLLREGTTASARTFALVVGSNGPARGTQRLRFAELDAEAFAKRLRQSGVRERDLTLLVGEAATRERVTRALAELGSRILGRDRLVVYFAGYGMNRQEGEAILLSDADEKELEATCLLVGTLAERCHTELLAHEVVFVLDASFGGRRGRTFPGSVDPQPASYLTSLGDATRGFAVLTAAGPSQAAREANEARSELQHGLFTFFLLRSLRLARSDSPLGLSRVLSDVRGAVGESALAFWGSRQVPQRLGAEADLLTTR